MDERCENCKFLCMLNVFDRGLKTIGGHGCISGVKVVTNINKFNESYGCRVFFETFGIVCETILNDKCELFQPKEKEEENHGEK